MNYFKCVHHLKINRGNTEQCNNVSWILLCVFIDAVIAEADLLYFQLELFLWCDVWHLFLCSDLATSPKSSTSQELVLELCFSSPIWQLSTFSSQTVLISLGAYISCFSSAKQNETQKPEPTMKKTAIWVWTENLLDSPFSRRKFWVQLPHLFLVPSFLEREICI